jgi:4-hydroxy-3-polyprenylbenzoate decarboxylase
MLTPPRRLIVGISGASGAIYGIRMLEFLRELQVESHLIISKAAQITIATETKYSLADVHALASMVHPVGDIAACISSGSFAAEGMVIAPCSMRTLGETASGVTSSLMSRAADVTLKERRRLVLMVRETPLHLGHLRNMTAVTEMGAIIAPPVPAFYSKPETLDDLVNHSVGRVLDLFGLHSEHVTRWQGLRAAQKERAS